MGKGKWTLESALTFLKANGQVPVDVAFLIDARNPPGLRAWGAIDFLCHYCGYHVERERE